MGNLPRFFKYILKMLLAIQFFNRFLWISVKWINFNTFSSDILHFFSINYVFHAEIFRFTSWKKAENYFQVCCRATKIDGPRPNSWGGSQNETFLTKSIPLGRFWTSIGVWWPNFWHWGEEDTIKFQNARMKKWRHSHSKDAGMMIHDERCMIYEWFVMHRCLYLKMSAFLHMCVCVMCNATYVSFITSKSISNSW